MLADPILDAIDSVESTDDFTQLLNKWKMSDASQEIKDEAIRELQVQKSMFDPTPVFTEEQVKEDMRAGEAEMPKMD